MYKDILRPRRFIRLDRLEKDQTIELEDTDVLLLGTGDVREVLKDAEYAGRLHPDSMVVELFNVDIDGESFVAARAMCYGLPERFCRVSVSTKFDRETGISTHSFVCSCDFGPLRKPPPCGPGFQSGVLAICGNNSCSKGNCRLRWGQIGRFSFGFTCECA